MNSQIDIFAELEKRNNLVEKKLSGTNVEESEIKKPTHFNPESNESDALLVVNNNLRNNILLSLSIYKKLNNFDHKYINELFNKKTESTA